LLLDEFEKGHKDVWNILLQLFDEGFVTDSHGRKIDFRNVIVIMTSNLGASFITELPDDMLGTEKNVRDMIMDKAIRPAISPELLNRIDEIVMFNRLQRCNMDNITRMNVNDINSRLQKSQNMVLDVSSNAMDCLSERGYDVRYGARPLKRTLAREILNPLSRLVLECSVVDGDTVRIRTRVEAEKELRQQNDPLGFVCGSTNGVTFGENSGDGGKRDESNDNDVSSMNDVVVMRNHPQPATVDEDEDDDISEAAVV